MPTAEGDEGQIWLEPGSIRGILLDFFAFSLNVGAMAGIGSVFRDTVSRASHDDPVAMRTLFGFSIAMFLLAPIGAVLGRWHYHRRIRQQVLEGANHLGGCLFNPIFYFCLTAVIFAAINAFVMQEVYGKAEPDGGVFVGSILGGIALMIIHVALVYRYFSPPKGPPRSAFLRSPISGYLGDACLFLNMALFQQIWGLLGEVKAPPPSSPFDFVFRILILFFLALLLYFPPRMFYLAEDIKWKWTWASILLANSPIIAKFVLGFG